MKDVILKDGKACRCIIESTSSPHCLPPHPSRELCLYVQPSKSLPACLERFTYMLLLDEI